MSARVGKVAVIGSGSWGTAMAGLLAARAGEVALWCRDAALADELNATRRNPRHLSSYELPAPVRATHDAADALEGAEVVVLAVPSAYLRPTCARMASLVPPEAPVLVLSKGVELGTHELMLDVAADELGGRGRVAVLSGPNHAEEVCLGKLSAAVLASEDPEVALRLQRLLVSPSFRVYVSQDVTGVEVCGAVKNVVAIACGAAVGFGAGDNTLAVIMTRGLAEIGRVAAALGADPLTPMGLAGMGDLVATCTSRHSRNRTFGEALARGETLEAFEAREHVVVEGARAAESVLALARAHGVEVPITSAVHAVLHDGVDVQEATDMLLGRRPSEEFYGISTQEKESN
ncbi:NAD(P)-dependent glycerol-3-phosphate dehydrogenase [Thermophilibacter sp. ET337]|uniref:NAD(P)H-dependent glycerol-3-phosphate dehydrogenase n=1 Tax=Thermophilibacter sp. ET337 TaxID=2973084 RepID=UPI0021ABA58E|nr:NAD(P)H-dependent glycerol-3-phosphate dehydrogenase [Thermophilibacter sp. ET337]MCR8908741.1 NAD(P)-dependent glycerol-3-phosphate dehydrogenase [Thermophilibacter sp. ET337]